MLLKPSARVNRVLEEVGEATMHHLNAELHTNLAAQVVEVLEKKRKPPRAITKLNLIAA